MFFFDPVSNNASNTEAIIVPAGQTRYFDLRGTITTNGGGTGNSVQVVLQGDSSRPVRNAGEGAQGSGTPGYAGGPQGFGASGQNYLATAAEAAAQSASNNFIWSPMSTSTVISSATSTTDWTNGFLVPGLSSTGLPANTFSN